jgi:hypothetical protein
MRFAQLALIVFYIAVPASLLAELKTGDLPNAGWYAHIDLTRMRSGVAGKQLYAWLDREVFDELREEFGFDADQEADSVTALAAVDGSTIVVIDGKFTQQTRDRVLAVSALAGDFDVLNHGGKDYYQIEDEPGKRSHDSFEDVAFVSLAVKNKLLVTSSEAQMQQMLDNGGSLPGNYDDAGALLVLRGTQSFIQAGMQTQLIDNDFGWDSNLLRNTKQLGLLVSDEAGALAVMAQLVAAEPVIANSLASIVRGLISLQALSGDVDAELSRLLNSTQVTVDGAILTVKLAIDPKVLIDVID